MSGGNGTFEIGAMRAYAIAHGVAADRVLLDAGGERTLASCVQARDVFEVRRLIVVSQEEHMARAVYTCRRVGIDADGVVAPEFTGLSRHRVPDTRALRPRARVARGERRRAVRSRLKRERPSALAEGRSSGGRTLVIA